MLSEGRPGVDDRYSLKDGKLVTMCCRAEMSALDSRLIIISGILRLELARDKYERCGLVGEPIRDAGRKHMKTRFGRSRVPIVCEIDLPNWANSCRSQSQVTVNVAWEKGLRENRMGMQERPQQCSHLALS